MVLKDNDVILFNGDSITDRGRDRADINSLTGYNYIIDQTLKLYRPQLKIKCYNKGISGATTATLLERLEGELTELQPTVVSLLIGINDVWHRYKHTHIDPIDHISFTNNYKKILDMANKFTDRIIILEPFLLPADPDKAKFREDLDPKIQIVRQLAAEYKAAYVPLDGIFGELSIYNGAEIYAQDGIHPTDDGHAVIAKEWLNRIKE